jgi:hypothetical protein
VENVTKMNLTFQNILMHEIVLFSVGLVSLVKNMYFQM